MSVVKSLVKSGLIKELANNYPNFLRKDLTKLFDIVVYEIKNTREDKLQEFEVYSSQVPSPQKALID